MVKLKKKFYEIIFNQELYFLSTDVTEFGRKMIEKLNVGSSQYQDGYS